MNYFFSQHESGAQLGQLVFTTRNTRGLDVRCSVEWQRYAPSTVPSQGRNRRGDVIVEVYRPGYPKYAYVGKSECGLGDTWDLEKGLEVAWGRLEASVPVVVKGEEKRYPADYWLVGEAAKVDAAQRLLKDLKRAVWAYLFQVDIEKVEVDATRVHDEVNQDPLYNKALWVEKEALLVANKELQQTVRDKDLWINALLGAKEKLQAEVANLKGKAQDDVDLFEDQLGQKDLEICDLHKQLDRERRLYVEQGVKLHYRENLSNHWEESWRRLKERYLKDVS